MSGRRFSPFPFVVRFRFGNRPSGLGGIRTRSFLTQALLILVLSLASLHTGTNAETTSASIRSHIEGRLWTTPLHPCGIAPSWNRG
jgi:hypothetical protein